MLGEKKRGQVPFLENAGALRYCRSASCVFFDARDGEGVYWGHMDQDEAQRVRAVFEGCPEIAAAYLFGSRARGTDRPGSDYDFAILLNDERLQRKTSYYLSRLEETLGTDRIDLLFLNTVRDPVLLRETVLLGICFHTRDATLRSSFERRALREYEDMRTFREVQARALREHIREGTFGVPLTFSR